MDDTSPEMRALYRSRLMELSGEKRLQMAASMFESARTLVLASLSHITDPIEKRRLLYERTYGQAPPADWH